MLNRRIVLTAFVVVLAVAFTAPSMQAGANLSNVNRVTFNRSVALPGVILLPGSYAFEAGALGMSPNIVRVTSPDYQKLYFVGLTQRVARPANMASNQVVALGEAPSANRPQSERGTRSVRNRATSFFTDKSLGCEGPSRDALRTRRVRSWAVCGPNPSTPRLPVKIHEYQAKSVLARFGVPVPRGEVAFAPAEAGEIARRLGGNVVVVKAQIHAGGRGKGGGVKLAKSPDEAEQIAKQMIGMTLVTHQTGPEGKKVSRVLVEEGLQIDRELYLSILIDRAAARPVVIASAAGGMDIEDVAAKQPEKILREHINRGTGIVPFQSRKLAFAMGLEAGPAQKLVKLLDALYKAFIETDASLIEINPLILTKERRPAGARCEGHLR